MTFAGKRPDSFGSFAEQVLRANLKEDLGLRVVADLYDVMQIDEKWSHFEGRGFVWWPLHLAQRVWADELRDDGGTRIWRVQARAEMWRGVGSDRAVEALEQLNKTTVLSAAVFEEPRGKVVLRCGVYVHEQNWEWVSKLFKLAVAIQADFALYGGQPGDFGAQVDNSAHTISGPRAEPDDMLNFREQIVFQGLAKRNDFRPADLKRAVEAAPRFWTVGAAGGAITMEVPFATYDTDPTDLSAEASLEAAAREDKRDPSDILRVLWFKDEGTDFRAFLSGATKTKYGSTALLQTIVDNPHPALGDGALIRLDLPIHPPNDAAVRLAQKLNLAETTEWVRSHFVGAWSVGPEGYLAHIVFIPAFAKPVDLLTNLLVAAAVRVRWAETFLQRRS